MLFQCQGLWVEFLEFLQRQVYYPLATGSLTVIRNMIRKHKKLEETPEYQSLLIYFPL